jgi:hypothetical protein
MQLTYNKFKQIIDKSSEKVFHKIAEAIATSDNAALVSMFDDKLILMDEGREEFYLCDYVLENKVLKMKNFEPIGLTENDSSYLDRVVENLFDVDEDEPVTVAEMMSAINLKLKNNSNEIFNEARDNKHRAIAENTRIRAIKKARQARDYFVEDIRNLMEEDFMQKLSLKVDGNDYKDSVPSALGKVKWEPSATVSVNTELGRPVNMIKIKDNTNVMDAMTDLAANLSDKWKSDSFRGKFEKMISQILATESVELARTAVLNFLDENKELFLLKKELFEELITKTTLMCNEGNSESVVSIFESIMATKPARTMKFKFFKDNGLTEEKIAQINRLSEEADAAPAPAPADGSAAPAPAPADGTASGGDSAGDLDSEELNKIIDIFKKIKDAIGSDKKADQDTLDYIDGLISTLDAAKVKGVDDSKMKEIIDFLANAGESKDKAEADAKPADTASSDTEVDI